MSDKTTNKGSVRISLTPKAQDMLDGLAARLHGMKKMSITERLIEMVALQDIDTLQALVVIQEESVLRERAARDLLQGIVNDADAKAEGIREGGGTARRVNASAPPTSQKQKKKKKG